MEGKFLRLLQALDAWLSFKMILVWIISTIKKN